LSDSKFNVLGWKISITKYKRETESIKFGRSKNVLIHQIENQSYEKTLLGQTNFDREVAPAIRAQAKLAVKDEYTFDFLELSEEGEKPSIGIILCKEKNRTIVEYALHDARKPIGAGTYRIVKRLPKELKGRLPGSTLSF